MSDNSLDKLIFNSGLLHDHLQKKKESFDALPDDEKAKLDQINFQIKKIVAELFTELERKAIANKFVRALRKSNQQLSEEILQREAEIFVETVQSWGEWAVDIAAQERRKQDVRKELANSFLNAVSKTIDTMATLDDAALGYLLSAGFEQVEADFPSETIPNEMKGNPFAFMILATDLKTKYSSWLGSFHAGMASAARELPVLSKDLASPQFVIAAAIEDRLGRLGMAFTTTETGLAGTVLHAVMNMANIELNKAGYWLEKARNHENSWISFTARIREKRDS